MRFKLFKHWWLGCAEFNLRYPHWKKTKGEYPICKICGSTAWWMWGYRHRKPDLVAQNIQGTKPNRTDAYWAKYDGY